MNLFFFSSRRRHTRWPRDWSSDVCSSDLVRIVGVLEHIDVLVAQLPHHGVDADALHADACADRVDALIVADDSNLGPISRLTNNPLDLDDTVVNLGHLELKQTLHKDGVGATDDHLRTRTGLTPHLFHHGPQHVSFAVAVFINLLFARENELRLIVDDQYLSPPDLINLADDDLADNLGILLKNVFLLDVANALAKGLPRRHYGSPPEVGYAHFAGNFVFDVEIFVDQLRFGDLDLSYRILEIVIRHHFLNMQDLDIAVIRVKDDLKRIVCAISFTDHGTEDVFHDHLKRIAVDAFLAGNLRERRYKYRTLHER